MRRAGNMKRGFLMNHSEVAPILDRMWKRFESLFVGTGQPAHWRQGSYRTGFFDVFRETYSIQPLHGEQVADNLKERFLEQNDERYEEKLKVLNEICGAWDEWKYAWDNHPSSVSQ
jgi:hypothetical protein